MHIICIIGSQIPKLKKKKNPIPGLIYIFLDKLKLKLLDQIHIPPTVAQHVVHPLVIGKVIGATHYHAQLGILRQRLCNQRVSCLMGKWTLYTAIIGIGAVTETLTNCHRPMLPLWSEKGLLLLQVR